MVIIILVIIAILVIGCCCYTIYNKSMDKGSDTEIIESTENYVGIYQYTLNDDAEGDTESSLELTSDKTFLFKANMCSGVLSIKGDYKIEKDVITLQNMSVHNDFKELLETNLHGSNTISFKIVSEEEIYLETSQFGCTTSGKEKGSFIKQ